MILWSVGMSFIPSSNYFIRSELLCVFVSKINFMQKVKYLLSCLKLCAVQEINLQICVFSLQRGKSSTTRTGEPKILSSRDFSPQRDYNVSISIQYNVLQLKIKNERQSSVGFKLFYRRFIIGIYFLRAAIFKEMFYKNRIIDLLFSR